MSDDLRVVSRYVTLADGRMLGLGDKVARDELTDPDTEEIAPHNQALIDDGNLLPIEPPKPPTVEQLRDRAGELDIDGRSTMTRGQLEKAIEKAEADQAAAEASADDHEEDSA